jgi:cobalt-zinc-cadmium efflux system outer membrane protein
MQRKLCLLLLASFCLSVHAEAQQTVALRTVEDLVRVAIAQNRDLAAAKARIEEAGGQVRQAGVRPSLNLELTGATGRPFGANNENQYGATLSKTIETFGKRAHRVAMADKTVLIAEAEYQGRVAQLTYALRSAYADRWSQERKLRTIDEILVAYRNTLQLTETRVREGDVASLEARLLQVEISRVVILRSSAQSRLFSTESDLRRLAGLSAAQALPTAEMTTTMPNDLAMLQRKALEDRPDLRLAAMEEEREKIGVALVRAESRPDVTVSTGWSRQGSAFDGLYGITAQGAQSPIREQNSTLSFGVSVPLRAARSSQGNLQSATARVTASRARREALEQSIPLEVEAAYQRWQVASQNVAMMQRDVLAPSTANLSVLQESYKLGQLRMIDVLNEQRRFLDAQLTAIDTQQDAQRNWAELERTVGGSIQ